MISAVLLDLVMPVMDGYDVLNTLSADPALSSIPIIVASQMDKEENEGKALELGARDFIVKPYNPSVLRKHLDNLIELYESNIYLNRIERDPLTKLYNKETFYRRATDILEKDSKLDYTLLVADIERFKLVNDSFGRSEGDRLLCYIAEQLDQAVSARSGICARLSADHFVKLLPETLSENAFSKIVSITEEHLSHYPLNMKISLKFGVYPITDREIPVEGMCDRAILAADNAKGQYHCVYTYYDDSIRTRMLREQKIIDSMKTALLEEQFLVYLQPKYDLESERIAGAEALVRWEHPELGFLSPNEFIPLFESNGFITEMDCYIWDKACAIILDWVRKSKKYVPVSVNVSRKDIYQADLPTILTGITKKHGLRPSQLHLEITETAYTENPEQLIGIVTQLKDLGFIIEMDDFGSGYSSLNMLSELPLDILKLDMRFIQKETDKDSSRNILSFIISLAKWMNLLVVAEGVESHSQIELLRNMDCTYVQGYYYARPMPSTEFTTMLMNAQLASPISAADRDWQEGAIHIRKDSGNEVMLIVDDIQLNRAILAEYFQNAYTIVEADNGEVAYHYIEEHFDEIAIILLDLIMPVSDGFQLLKRLRSNPLLTTIPVIVTSQAGETSEAQAFELGASDFIPKPYNMDIAIHRVQNVTARNAIQTLEREKRMLTKMKQLALEAKLDQLTGIYNRMEMERQVQEFFLTNEDQTAIFFMLDIDNFKAINDRFGHDQGDVAIRRVANTLQTMFREDDLVCRMGGDEFAVFMRAQFTHVQLIHRLEQMSTKLRFKIGHIEVTCSIGVCISPNYGTEYQDVYHNADVALLTAKRLGKNRYHIFGGEARLPDQVIHRNLDWLLDESSDAIVVIDPETYEIYYLNDAACTLSGKNKETCLSLPCYKAIWNNSKPCSHCVHISKLTHDYCEHEIQSEYSENSYIIKGKLIDWGDQQARIQYIQDNTNRARISRKTESLAKDRQLLLDLLPGGLIRYNASTLVLTFINENMLNNLGYDQDTFHLKYRHRFDLMIRPEARTRVLEEIQEQLAHGDTYTCIYPIERMDGSFCTVYSTGRYTSGPTGGEIYANLMEVPQITKKKLADV